MRKVYIKNYKGFDEAVIELKDVNFFVGENSTGKTSILKLINILNSRDFWFTEQFNNNEVELGYFDEILNRNTVDKFFRIGIELNKEDEFRRILIEFKDYKSVPKVSKIKYCTRDFDSLLVVSSKQVSYKNKKVEEVDFLTWANNFNYPNPSKKLEAPFLKLPLFVLFSFIESMDGNKKNRIKSLASDAFLYNNYLWLAPIRAKAKRIYESYEVKFSPEGEHIPSMLRELFSNSAKKDKQKILDILNQFGRESKLYDEILVKNYGTKNASPFEINVRYESNEIKLPNVGYGVSQSLPLIVEILSAKNTTFSIQQPEVHLHPRAQAAFGSFLYNASTKDKNSFLVETHSDFTINRFRYCLSKKNEDSIKSQVLFFTRIRNTNQVNHIEIEKDGSFLNGVPDEYREFFIDEELKLLEL